MGEPRSVTRIHVVVRGRVQGVGFRWYVREKATALGLAGWVKNRADGAVEVAAEGDADAVRRLREHLARGPTNASVSAVDEVSDPEVHSTSLQRPFSIVR